MEKSVAIVSTCGENVVLVYGNIVGAKQTAEDVFVCFTKEQIELFPEISQELKTLQSCTLYGDVNKFLAEKHHACDSDDEDDCGVENSVDVQMKTTGT